MKKYYLILAAVAAMLSAVGCNKEQNTPDNPEPVEGQEVTIKVTIPEELSKVALNYTGSALALTWSAGDKITVKDHSNPSNAQDFTLTSGEGTKSATFTGTAISAASYDITLTSNMPSGAGVFAQTQSADANTGHLGYAATLSGVNTYEDVTFSSTWASSKGGTLAQSGALHLQATLPAGVAAVVNSVTMVADKNIFGATGTMNVAISSPADTGSDDVLDVYATIPAGGVTIPSGTNLLFKFNTTDGSHSVYTRHFLTSSVLNLAGGQLNKISLTCTNTDKYAGKDDDGTAAHPYLIADKYQMLAMNSLMASGETKYFKLMADIDLNGVTWTSLNPDDDSAIDLDGNNFTVSNFTNPLFTYLDGKVSNLTITGVNISSSKYYGVLVRTITKDNCVISNVSVSNSSVSGSQGIGGLIGRITATSSCEVTNCSADVAVTGSSYYLGGLIGYMTVGTIEGCHASGDVTCNLSGTYAHCGGLIGTIVGGTVNKCYATGDVKETVSGKGACVGGLIGDFAGPATVSKSYATGNVSNSYTRVGGLVGAVGKYTISISDCYSSGSVTANNDSGGFIGYLENDAGANLTITNGYSTSSLSVSGSRKGILCGNTQTNGSITCTGFVNLSSTSLYSGTVNPISGHESENYSGTEGTILSHAQTFGWNFSTIWNEVNPPTLK